MGDEAVKELAHLDWEGLTPGLNKKTVLDILRDKSLRGHIWVFKRNVYIVWQAYLQIYCN